MRPRLDAARRARRETNDRDDQSVSPERHRVSSAARAALPVSTASPGIAEPLRRSVRAPREDTNGAHLLARRELTRDWIFTADYRSSETTERRGCAYTSRGRARRQSRVLTPLTHLADDA